MSQPVSLSAGLSSGDKLFKVLAEADKTCQLRVLPGPEAPAGAGLSLGRGGGAVAGH